MALQDLISDFTVIIEKIFSLQEKKQVALANILRDHYNNYKIMLQKISPEDHSDFFLSPFKKNRLSILADKSDSWIREGPVYIQWNEGVKNCNPKYKINLSGIYNTALRLAKDAKESFSQLVGKEKLSIEQMYPEVRFPDLLLYHYYKLVHYYMKQLVEGPKGIQNNSEQKDLDSLSSIIIRFEQHLGMKKESASNSNQSGTGASQPISDIVTGLPFGEIMNEAAKLMQTSDIKFPENTKLPSSQEFSGMIQGLFNNPQIQNFVNGLFKSIEGARTPQEAFSKVINSKDMAQIITPPPIETQVTEIKSETKSETEENVSLVQFD